MSVPSAKKLYEQVEKMNSFGVRLTGTEAQRNFIDYLKKEVRKMGFEVYSDPYRFMRWEEKHSALTIHGADDVEIPVSSAFPYSGRTSAEGVTGELVHIKEKHIGYLAAKDKIAVVEVDNLGSLSSEIAFDERGTSVPEGLKLPTHYNGPVATSFINFPFLNMAKIAGAKAVVCIWKGINSDCIKGQYLPFILDYFHMPALWVDAENGEKIIEAAKNGQTATLTLESEIENCAETETFYCILEGENKEECVIVNTHTDGTNCIEENGPIAMLAMIKELKDKPLKRTHIFVFVTGHFRLPNFKDINGGGVQATSKWLAAHKSLWDGKDGHIKAVAGLSLEHFGCRMWKENEEGQYAQVGDIETEIVYTGNKTMNDIYFKSLEGRTKVHTLTLRGHNFLHFGEGQPLFNVGIPEIALVTAPDCLCVVSDNHEIDKFDPELMREQIKSFIKMDELIEELSTDEIGKVDGYSTLTTNRMTNDSVKAVRKIRAKVKNIIK